MDAINKMTDAQFLKMSLFIHQEYGIKLSPAKKTMLESRLQKRLRTLHLSTFKEYFELLFSSNGMQHELVHMIDKVTTNKTDFFREADHFEFLTTHILPSFQKSGLKSSIKVWSAGCSSGEEPYTLGMILSDFNSQHPGFDYSILGTDISSEVLAKAIAAIYDEERIAQVALPVKQRFFLKSKDQTNKTVRVIPEIRKKVSFQRLNFMDDNYSVQNNFEIIFCRNVLIYFTKETQEKVINKLASKLGKGGYLFLGHSESIANMHVPLKQIRPTIFQKI